MAHKTTAGRKKFSQLGDAAFERNGEKGDSDVRCFRCNLPVDDGDAALFVHVVDGGWMVRRPGAVKGEMASDCGYWPLGPECAKSYAGYAFTMKDWSELEPSPLAVAMRIDLDPTVRAVEALPVCPVCRLPAHAYETDDLDRHSECQDAGDAECTECGDRFHSAEGHPTLALCAPCTADDALDVAMNGRP